MPSFPRVCFTFPRKKWAEIFIYQDYPPSIRRRGICRKNCFTWGIFTKCCYILPCQNISKKTVVFTNFSIRIKPPAELRLMEYTMIKPVAYFFVARFARIYVQFTLCFHTNFQKSYAPPRTLFSRGKY